MERKRLVDTSGSHLLGPQWTAGLFNLFSSGLREKKWCPRDAKRHQLARQSDAQELSRAEHIQRHRAPGNEQKTARPMLAAKVVGK